MRRRRKKRETLGVSLFPFLAVLICTLGVLIVLLVIAVQSADVNSQRAQASEQERFDAQQAELDQLQSDYEIRLAINEGLERVRPQVVSRLADARSHRGHLEEQIRQLKRRTRELGRELQVLAKDDPIDVDLIDADDQIESLKKQIQLAQADLKRKRTKAQESTGPTTYSIVPHEGSGGTFRRPIYIECTADELVIQPLGIRLGKAEFTPPLQSGNMLDAALLAIREYWQRYDVGGEEGNPYPLLIVRPDGAETYVLARRAMKSWDDEFGYELVEADKTLEFGSQDEQLVDVVNVAVQDARKRQQLIAARYRARAKQMGGPGSFGSSGSSKSQSHGPGLSASGGMGGFVSNSDWKTGAHEYANSIAQASGQQSEFGDRDSGSRNKKSSRSISGGQPGSGVAGEMAGRNGSGGSHQVGASASKIEEQPTNQSAGSPSSQDPSYYPDSSLAKERGKNWALPSQTPGAVGYVRPIRIVCGAKELEIRSALGTDTVIPFDGEIENAVDPLVNEIWSKIESWGPSGARSFWKPELRVSVLSGGELNYQKLRALLDDSGVSVRGGGR